MPKRKHTGGDNHKHKRGKEARNTTTKPQQSPRKRYASAGSGTSAGRGRGRRRRHRYNEELPQYLDAESSVTAIKFGARRLPEMKSLWRSFLQQQYEYDPEERINASAGAGKATKTATRTALDDVTYYRSGGCKSSNRHLRRRTGSHNRRKRHRYPSGSGSGSGNGDTNTDADADANGDDADADVNVNGDTNGGENRNNDNGIGADSSNGNGDKSQSSNGSRSQKSRRARRKPALLRMRHGTWKQEDNLTLVDDNNHDNDDDDGKKDSTSNSNSEACTSTRIHTNAHAQSHTHTHSRHSHWLETHLWHCKRFHMTHGGLNIYNDWCVPLIHTNRGTRAAMRLVQNKATVQDATWEMGGTCITIRSTWSSSSHHNGSRSTCRSSTSSSKDGLMDFVEKICGGSSVHSAPFLSREHVRMGLEVGYGLIYDRNNGQFPSGVVGPASFLFGKDSNDGADADIGMDTDTDTDTDNDMDTATYFVRIIVEGSILKQVKKIIHEVIRDMNHHSQGTGVELTTYVDALTLIRVRGLEATGAIARSLKFRDGNGSHGTKGNEDTNRIPTLDWNDLSSKCDNHLHLSLPHGSILKATFLEPAETTTTATERTCHGTTASSEKSCQSYTTAAMVEEKIDEIHEQLMEQEISILNSAQLQTNGIILIAHAPNQNGGGSECERELIKKRNLGVSGWDILCPPNLATQIFSALNMVGGACAIGYVEEACFKMEADPPLPVWPRDYPDTEIGRAYWSGDNDANAEWRLLRYCIEEGLSGGKIQTGLKRLLKRCSRGDEERDDCDRDENVVKVLDDKKQRDKKNHNSPKLMIPRIDWDSLSGVSISLENSQPIVVVVVRGNFTAPFMQALNGFGQDYFEAKRSKDQDAGPKRKRRPRRRVKGMNDLTVIPPSASTRLAAQQQICENLLSSLSIPALLRCSIEVEGKGGLHSGMAISTWAGVSEVSEDTGVAHESKILGHVVSGGFSQSRGKFHGIGFISSCRFLSHLKSGSRHGSFLIRKRENNLHTVALRVCVQSDNQSTSAIASLTILT